MNAEPTPGPWKWRVVTDASGILAMLLETEHRPISHNDPVVLAVREDWLTWLDSTPTGKANARLIAAAPALRDALAEAAKSLRIAASELRVGLNDLRLTLKAADRAEAALKAAAGGEGDAACPGCGRAGTPTPTKDPAACGVCGKPWLAGGEA